MFGLVCSLFNITCRNNIKDFSICQSRISDNDNSYTLTSSSVLVYNIVKSAGIK